MAQSRNTQPFEDHSHIRMLAKKHSRRSSSNLAIPRQKDHTISSAKPRIVQKSPFLQLPGDIRNIIYDFVFHRPDGMHVDMDADQKLSNDYHGLFSLSMTCREIYNETRDLPFWLNTVHLRAPVLQDLSVVRSSRYRASTPIHLASHREMAGKSDCGNLASTNMAIRQKAQDGVTLAMRQPHVEHITTRLWSVLNSPATLQRLRRVHVHLGFQTNNVFIERFYTAWMEILPYLRLLRGHADLRVSFQLRLSRRLVVHYDFKVDDADAMLREMDACVLADGELSLPELATANAVRFRVWSELFGADDIGKCPVPYSLPRRRKIDSRDASRAVVGGGVRVAV